VVISHGIIKEKSAIADLVGCVNINVTHQPT